MHARPLPQGMRQAGPPAQHLRLARRRARQRREHRLGGGAVQEHPQGLLPQCQCPRPEKGRRGGGGGKSGTRHRSGDAHRKTREAADKESQPQVDGRHQARLPHSQAGGPRQMARGEEPRARHHDTEPPDSQGPEPADENRRRGIPGRRQQGDILLYSRRARGLPPAHQGARRYLPRED